LLAISPYDKIPIPALLLPETRLSSRMLLSPLITSIPRLLLRAIVPVISVPI
jgi:hypothetical protein